MRCEQLDCDFDRGHEGGHGIYVGISHAESCPEPWCVLAAGHEEGHLTWHP